MIRIVSMSADDYSAEASVELFAGRDTLPKSYTVSILPDEYTYCVFNEEGKCAEKYKCLSRCAESAFFHVFTLLPSSPHLNIHY